MESKVSRNSDNGISMTAGDKAEYKEALRKQLNKEVKKIIDFEIQKAAQELMEEHKKATIHIVEEYRAIIHQVVQEEKEEIRRKTEALKNSILLLGV